MKTSKKYRAKNDEYLGTCTCEVIRQGGHYAGDVPGYVCSHGTVCMQTEHYTIEIFDVHSLYIHINIRYWYMKESCSNYFFCIRDRGTIFTQEPQTKGPPKLEGEVFTGNM